MTQVLYSIPVFISLTLIAIVIALFVFASSFYKGALELSTKEEENYLNRRKKLISNKREELRDKIGDVDENAFPKELRRDLDKFDAELENMDQSIAKSKNKAKALAVRNVVLIPVSLLLASIIASGIAIATSGTVPLAMIMFIVSLIFIVISLYFIFKNLFLIESFSRTTDLGTLMEQALDKHAAKRQPIVDMDVWDFQLEILRGETRQIEYYVFLKQGTIGKNTKVLFLATQELVFPAENVKPSGLSKSGRMKKPNYFTHQYATINPGMHGVSSFKVKVPDTPGEYDMSYLIECDEYAGKERTFTIKVV